MTLLSGSPTPTQRRRQQREERLAHANAVIQAVSDHGRRFFYGEDSQRRSMFRLDDRGALWFDDHYRGTPVYVAYKGNWRGFSEGGTLRSMVEALALYIREGTPIRPGHFGPWNPGIIPNGDLWGYGAAAMTAVRAQLDGNPAVGVRPVAPVTQG